MIVIMLVRKKYLMQIIVIK